MNNSDLSLKILNSKNIFLFTLPSIIMMLFTSLFSIIDGIFIARYVGAEALAAVNIAFPLINFLVAIGVMLGSGGNAIIAKTLGEQKKNLLALFLLCFLSLAFYLLLLFYSLFCYLPTKLLIF